MLYANILEYWDSIIVHVVMCCFHIVGSTHRQALTVGHMQSPLLHPIVQCLLEVCACIM